MIAATSEWATVPDLIRGFICWLDSLNDFWLGLRVGPKATAGLTHSSTTCHQNPFSLMLGRGNEHRSATLCAAQGRNRQIFPKCHFLLFLKNVWIWKQSNTNAKLICNQCTIQSHECFSNCSYLHLESRKCERLFAFLIFFFASPM